MKSRIPILALGLFVGLALGAAPADERPPSAGQNQETRMLYRLLQMPPEELAALRTTIERIESMSPEEKARLRERIGKLEKMPPERVQAMRKRFQSIDPQTRAAMRQRWLEMAPEERRQWRHKLREMSPEERSEIFEAEGFHPAPGRQQPGRKPPQALGD